MPQYDGAHVYIETEKIQRIRLRYGCVMAYYGWIMSVSQMYHSCITATSWLHYGWIVALSQDGSTDLSRKLTFAVLYGFSLRQKTLQVRTKILETKRLPVQDEEEGGEGEGEEEGKEEGGEERWEVEHYHLFGKVSELNQTEDLDINSKTVNLRLNGLKRFRADLKPVSQKILVLINYLTFPKIHILSSKTDKGLVTDQPWANHGLH